MEPYRRNRLWNIVMPKVASVFLPIIRYMWMERWIWNRLICYKENCRNCLVWAVHLYWEKNTRTFPGTVVARGKTIPTVRRPV